MRIMIKKSVADQICRYWGLPLVKSVKTRRQRFLEIKAELLKHCKQKLREAQAEEAKSLEDATRVIKENKFKEKLADMTAKVDNFLSKEHTEVDENISFLDDED